ncbi:MAG: DUF2628 domain-containing protein [Candidatus Gastranaerophilales bacterium]|nr:DUF2628 domain-containing protein [Candidatus Gastranaerophilales bacterium]
MNDYSMENAEQEKLQKELKKFNWGAFGFGWIWAVCNGAWNDYFPAFLIMIAAALISKVPVVGPLFGILCPGIAIYVGTKANEWAYNGTKQWKSLESFVDIQKKWAIGFVVYILLYVIIFGVYYIFLIKYNKPEHKICKSYIQDIVNAPDYAKFNSGKDIAEYFVKLDPQKNTLFGEDGDSIFVGNKYGFVFKFFKYGTCSLDKYNCYMIYNSVIYHKKYQPVEKEEQVVTPVYKVFFDEKGKTKFIQLKEKIKYNI